MNGVDELQEAFNACLAVPADDLRSSAEQNIARFIEAARKLEVFFLQKQLLLSDSGDNCEDISKLKAKLRARDNLLAKLMHNKAKKLKDRIVGTFLNELRESNFFQVDFVNSFKECLNKLGDRKIEQILCYGLGSFSNGVDISSRYQLALLLLLHELLIEGGTNVCPVIEIYDPSFDELDKLTLASFTKPKFKLIAENEYCGRRIEQGSCTLIYMPHLDKYLYNNLIGVNWDTDSLSKLVILGNSFREMIDSETSSKCRRELYYLDLLVSNFKKHSDISTGVKKKTKSKAIEQTRQNDQSNQELSLVEIGIDDELFDHSDIFNSLSFQFVNTFWLMSNSKKIQQNRLTGWTCVTSQPIDDWT